MDMHSHVRSIERYAAFKRHVKLNYKGDINYSRKLWKCEKMDSEQHILWCEGFKHLREGKDMKNDKDLCDYIRKICQIRAEAEKPKSKPQTTK